MAVLTPLYIHQCWKLKTYNPFIKKTQKVQKKLQTSWSFDQNINISKVYKRIMFKQMSEYLKVFSLNIYVDIGRVLVLSTV